MPNRFEDEKFDGGQARFTFSRSEIASLRLINEYASDNVVWELKDDWAALEPFDLFIAPSESDISESNPWKSGLIKDTDRGLMTIQGCSFIGIHDNHPEMDPAEHIRQTLLKQDPAIDIDARNLTALRRGFCQGAMGFMDFIYLGQCPNESRKLDMNSQMFPITGNVSFETVEGESQIRLQFFAPRIGFRDRNYPEITWSIPGNYTIDLKLITHEEQLGFQLERVRTNNPAIAEILQGNAEELIGWNFKRAQFSADLDKIADTLLKSGSTSHAGIKLLTGLLSENSGTIYSPKEIFDTWLSAWSAGEEDKGNPKSPAELLGSLNIQETSLGYAIGMMFPVKSTTMITLERVFPNCLIKNALDSSGLANENRSVFPKKY